MDAGMQIKELASKVGVTKDTVINWESRGMKLFKRQAKQYEAAEKNIGHISRKPFHLDNNGLKYTPAADHNPTFNPNRAIFWH